jgi:hypothetical protein
MDENPSIAFTIGAVSPADFEDWCELALGLWHKSVSRST